MDACDDVRLCIGDMCVRDRNKAERVRADEERQRADFERQRVEVRCARCVCV
jgi:hypothetical protein